MYITDLVTSKGKINEKNTNRILQLLFSLGSINTYGLWGAKTIKAVGKRKEMLKINYKVTMRWSKSLNILKTRKLNVILKGYNETLSSFTHPHAIPNLYDFLSHVEEKRR